LASVPPRRHKLRVPFYYHLKYSHMQTLDTDALMVFTYATVYARVNHEEYI